MLSAYVNASDMEGAEKFFKRLKQDGFEPNVVTYGALIKGYAKVNNLEKMMEKYEEMRLSDIKANQTIFTTIMDAYGKHMDFGSAVVWYKEMLACGIPPDRKAKNVLLSLSGTAEEKEEATELVGNLDPRSKQQTLHEISGSGEEDDEDDDDEMEYSEEPKDTSSCDLSRDELIFVNGDQYNREGLHSLSSVKL